MPNATSTPIAQLLLEARRRLVGRIGLCDAEARIEAQLLMRRALGDVSHAWLISHQQDAADPQQASVFATLLERRLAGEPIAYLLGEREFFGLRFAVTPDVLIPRPDTETLVEAALRTIPAQAPCRVLDLGTGSGAIAIAIAVHRPQARVVATDRSAQALAVAKANARALRAGNLEFRLGRWFDTLPGETFDLIVSNPPYIAAGDPHLAQGDLRFEPREALVSGQDGLDDIRTIVRTAPRHLRAGGRLLLEHGYDQAQRVAELLGAAGFGEILSLPDLAGVLRVTGGVLSKTPRSRSDPAS